MRKRSRKKLQHQSCLQKPGLYAWELARTAIEHLGMRLHVAWELNDPEEITTIPITTTCNKSEILGVYSYNELDFLGRNPMRIKWEL